MLIVSSKVGKWYEPTYTRSHKLVNDSSNSSINIRSFVQLWLCDNRWGVEIERVFVGRNNWRESLENSDNPVKKREIFGWAFFDFANSSYVTVVITAIYSSFFVKYVIPEDHPAPNSLWSSIIVVGTIIAMLLSPLAGAICDLAGKKKGYLIGATLICAVSTMGLYFVDGSTLWLGALLVVVSYVAFMLSETFCASFLTDIATPKTMGLISGLGWGIGYFGGLVSLLIVKAVAGGEDGSPAEIVASHQDAMVATGLFFAVAALPTFIWVKERSKPQAGFEAASLSKLASAGAARMFQTIRMVRKHERLFRFFIAFLFYSAGVGAAVTFSGIFARTELEMTTADLITFFAIIQVLAAVGAMLFGVLGIKAGLQRNPDLHAHSLGGRNAGHFPDRCALSCAWNHAKRTLFH